MKKEQIPGGLAKGKSLKDIATKHIYDDSKDSLDKAKMKKMLAHLKNELEKGIKTELEHTSSKKYAKEIAMDHLFEDPHYYTKLKKFEKMNESKLRDTIKKIIKEEQNSMPHKDHEAMMAKGEIRDMVKNAKEVYKMIQPGDELPGWISAYITLASDYMHSIAEYMIEKNSGGEELQENSDENPKKLTMDQFANWLGLPADKVQLAIEITRMSDADGAYTHLEDMGEDDAAAAVEAIYFEYGSLKEAIQSCKEDLGI